MEILLLLNGLASKETSFLLVAVALKCLLILCYTSILYLILSGIKKLLHDKVSVRMRYYRWYLLVLAIPLSYLEVNSSIKLAVYRGYEVFAIYPIQWYICYILAVLWAFSGLYRLISLEKRYLKLKLAVDVCKPISIDQLTHQMAVDLGLNKRKITIREASWISSPNIYGIFRKVILLPLNYQECYSKTELEYLLLHEMTHIKHHDFIKIVFIQCLNCFFMIPLGFIKQFKQDSEILCDNLLLSEQNADADIVDDYSVLLIKESSQKSIPFMSLAFFDSSQSLQSRLHALDDFKPIKHSGKIVTVFLMACFVATFLQSYFIPDRWFTELYPPEPVFYIHVTFDNESYEEIYGFFSEYDRAYVETGIMPTQLPGRPGRPSFDGTYEILDERTIRYDSFAIAQVLRGMEMDGHQAEFAHIIMVYKNLCGNMDVIEHAVQIGDKFSYFQSIDTFEVVDETSENRYQTMTYENLNYYFYKFAAYWL